MNRLLIILVTLICCCCRSAEYIPVESVRTDTIYVSRLQHDSTIVKDSVHIREKNDTVYLYRYKYIYRDRVARDTSYIEKADTIRIPYPVEGKSPVWQVVRFQLITWVIGSGIIIFIWIISIFVKRARHK